MSPHGPFASPLAHFRCVDYLLQVRPSPTNLAALIALLQRRLPGLLGVWLFGSVARGTARPDSDLDIAVLGAAPFDAVQLFDLGLELGVLVQRDVDLVDLRRLPIVVQKEVLLGGERLAAFDTMACDVFESDAIALYVAFRDELALASGGEDRR